MPEERETCDRWASRHASHVCARVCVCEAAEGHERVVSVLWRAACSRPHGPSCHERPVRTSLVCVYRSCVTVCDRCEPLVAVPN